MESLYRYFPECRVCLDGLATSAAVLAAKGDPGLASAAEKAAREALGMNNLENLSSPQIANIILGAIRQYTGVFDPYEQVKLNEMRLARQAFRQIRPFYPDDPLSLVKLAVLGNSLDFFKSAEEVLFTQEATAQGSVELFHNDSAQFFRRLAKKSLLAVYLTDNSGEIFFDLPLFNYIAEKTKEIILAVKGGPALNDLTRNEIKKMDLEANFPNIIDTGTDGPGVDWEKCSATFLDTWSRADLIVSKGMANFETVYPRPSRAAVLFLFKVKCLPFKNILDAPPDSYWSLWREGDHS